MGCISTTPRVISASTSIRGQFLDSSITSKTLLQLVADTRRILVHVRFYHHCFSHHESTTRIRVCVVLMVVLADQVVGVAHKSVASAICGPYGSIFRNERHCTNHAGVLYWCSLEFAALSRRVRVETVYPGRYRARFPRQCPRLICTESLPGLACETWLSEMTWKMQQVL